MIAIWRNLWSLSVGKRSSSSFPYSFTYYKYIVNLLFWLLWACLAKQTESDTINLWKIFVFICRQKNQFHPHAFLEILQRYANFLFWVLWACLVAHPQNDSIKTSIFICMQQMNLSFTSFLRYYILKNPAIWLADNILVHNSRNRILPDMELVVKYQQ